MQIQFFRTDGVNEALLNAVRRLCGQQAQEFLAENPAGNGLLKWIEENLHTELGRAVCRRSYADKRGGEGGRYQDQPGLTLPTVDQ